MEYRINIVYAFVLSRLHKRVTLLLTLAAAVWLAVVAYHAGTLIGGCADANIMDGFARVSFSFLAGLSVYRFQRVMMGGGYLAMRWYDELVRRWLNQKVKTRIARGEAAVLAG